MRRRKAWALAWLLAATLSALLAPGTPAQGDELLGNGGFEDELSGEWRTISEDDTIERLCEPDPEAVVRGGSCAGKLTCHGRQKCELSQAVLAVGYGQHYELRGYIARSHEGPTTLVRVDWYESGDATGPRIDWPRESSPCTEASDESYECVTTHLQGAPREARSAKVEVTIISPPEGFTVYLDDFSFSGPPAPSPSPTSSPTPTATPSPTPSPSPSPSPTASPTPFVSPKPSPTALPTATQTPTREPSTPSPSPTASSWSATPFPVGGLVNGGFEEADDDGRPLGWRKYGGELARSSAARWEGQYAAAFTSRTASTKWAFQTVAVQGGRAYILSGYALNNDANVEAAYLRLSWYASPDGSGQAIDRVDSTTRLTDDSPDFRFLTTDPVVAPTDAASAKVRLMLDPVSEAEGKVYFDAVSFDETSRPTPTPTAVPSPTQRVLPPPPPEETATPPTATQTPLPPPSDEGGSPTPSAVAAAPSVEELQPSPSPTASRPSSTVLGASSAGPEATASPLAEPSRTQSSTEDTRTGTPVVLYRERRDSPSPQAGESVTAADERADGLSPILLVLATAVPAVGALGAGSYLWRRARRTRPP